MLKWMTDPSNPVNLGVLYFAEPDETGHQYGPHGAQTLRIVETMDSLLGYLFWSLERAGLLDQFNIILTADHGMADVPVANQINLDKYIHKSWYETYGAGPNWNINPKPGYAQEIIDRLSKVPNMKVYRKSEMPEEYHYKHCANVMPIQLEADLHYVIVQKGNGTFPRYHTISGQRVPAMDTDVFGAHGYNNSLTEMHPIFTAMGPAFKTAYNVSQFNTVDLYPLMSYILGVKPPPNNGSFDIVKSLLKDDGVLWAAPTGQAPSSFKIAVSKLDTDHALYSILFVVVIIALAVCFINWRNYNSRSNAYYRSLRREIYLVPPVNNVLRRDTESMIGQLTGGLDGIHFPKKRPKRPPPPYSARPASPRTNTGQGPFFCPTIERLSGRDRINPQLSGYTNRMVAPANNIPPPPYGATMTDQVPVHDTNQSSRISPFHTSTAGDSGTNNGGYVPLRTEDVSPSS